MARGGRPARSTDLALWAVPFGARRRPALPRHHRLTTSTSARAATRSRRSTSGSGGLGVWGAIALGAARRLDRRAGARASGCCRCSTRSRPACWSPRRSAAGATGSTRSCSAGRPTCRGGWRSTPATGPRGYLEHTRPSTRRSSTSRSGTSRRFAVVIWADRRFQLGHGRVLALYVMAYTLGRGWIEMLRIDDVQLTTCSACGSTCGPRSCCSCSRGVLRGGRPAAPRPRGGASTSRGAPATEHRRRGGVRA